MDKKARQLQADWEALLKKHSKPLERGAQAFGVKTYRLKPKVEKNQEELQKIRSLVTPGGDTPKSPPKIYTGDKIIGIAVMHKSNMVPIFNEQAAVDVATMRRN
jgi:hypothetical protein